MVERWADAPLEDGSESRKVHSYCWQALGLFAREHPAIPFSSPLWEVYSIAEERDLWMANIRVVLPSFVPTITDAFVFRVVDTDTDTETKHYSNACPR